MSIAAHPGFERALADSASTASQAIWLTDWMRFGEQVADRRYPITPSSRPAPNESETTEPLVPLGGSTPDEASSSLASSGPIPDDASGLRSFVQTHDGTCIIVDGNITVSARTREEAEFEVARRKAGAPMSLPLW